MWRIYAGAVSFLAGVSAFVVDARHRRSPGVEAFGNTIGVHTHEQGLSGTAYDLIHVAGWVLIVAGVLLIIMGLIRYSVAARALSWQPS